MERTYRNERIKKNNIIVIALTTTLFIELLMIKNFKSLYAPLIICPIAYSMMIMIFIDVYKCIGDSLVLTACVVGSILQMDIIPVLNFISSEVSFLNNVDIINRNIFNATLITIYGVFVTHFLLYLEIKKKKECVAQTDIENLQMMAISRQKWILIIFLFIVVVFICFLYPSYLKVCMTYLKVYFFNISSSANLNIYIERYSSLSNIKNSLGYMYWIVTYCFNLFNYILPGIICSFIYKKCNNKIVKNLLLLLLAGIMVIFVSNEAYISYTVAIVILLLLYESNKAILNKNKLWIFVSVVAIVCGAIYALKIKNGNMEGGTASLINAYFPSYNNLCYSLEVENAIRYILNDLLQAIPFIRGFFLDLPSGINHFTEIINSNRENSSQIISILGQGEIYFGSFFAPVFQIVTLNIALNIEKKIYQADTFWMKYLSMIFCVSIMLCIYMYNFSILIVIDFQLLPCYLYFEYFKVKSK